MTKEQIYINGYKAKCDIRVYLHLIVEYRLSPLTIMGRMCKTTRVENRGETTRGERTRGETSWGPNLLLPFWAGPQITKLFLGPSLLLAKNVSVSLISKHNFTYTMLNALCREKNSRILFQATVDSVCQKGTVSGSGTGLLDYGSGTGPLDTDSRCPVPDPEPRL